MKRRAEWWRSYHNLLAVIGWAREVGEFTGIEQVEHFLEKPWLYDDLWAEYRESLGVSP